MSSTAHEQAMGVVRAVDGAGSVRVALRLDAGLDEVWSAITTPERLARWYGAVEGDLRVGGTARVRIERSGWDGVARVDVCEPAHRLRVTTKEHAETDEQVVQADLAAAGDQTELTVQTWGHPLEKVEFYGVGWQLHLERLDQHLHGLEEVDEQPRWAALLPAYQEQAAALRQ